jgi:hypothetical protein
MAGRLAFLQAFPNLACFCPSFSKQIFGGFVRFQRVASLKNPKCRSPNFLPLPPPFNLIPSAAPPHSARSRRRGSAWTAARSGVRSRGVGACTMGASDPWKERILNLARLRVIGNKFRPFDAASPATQRESRFIDASNCADCVAWRKKLPDPRAEIPEASYRLRCENLDVSFVLRFHGGNLSDIHRPSPTSRAGGVKITDGDSIECTVTVIPVTVIPI